MTAQFIETIETQDGWQSTVAFQVFHRPPGVWKEMRWGFNAGALLEEAIDRNKLFLESQAINETVFFENNAPTRTLALRGMQLPGSGLQMALLAKVVAAEKIIAEQCSLNYAREIATTFPYDFIIKPAITHSEYEKLTGSELLAKSPEIVSVQKEITFIPPMRGFDYLNGLWQASVRSNEQIWRALSGMQKMVMFNILLQPTILLEDEKELLLEIKNKVLKSPEKPDIFAPYYPWVENYIKRRLAPWKRYFLLQIHLAAEGEVDENLSRSVGSAITRETNENPLPGFHITYPNSPSEATDWLKDIRLLNVITPQRRMDDLADLDEALSVFRFPLQHETGLPGANFIEPSKLD